MESVELTVRGDGVRELPRAITGFPRHKRVDHAGDDFAVVVAEQYFFRTNSNLLTTTIFDVLDDTTCTVRVVAGGGGVGLTQEDLWSESSEAGTVVGKVETFCEEHGLDVERG